MSFRWLACAVVLAGFYTTPVPSQPSQDTVTLNDDAGEENGIIFWGSETDHKVFTGPSANIPDIDRGTANQLVAFTKGRAPALDDDVAWSSGHDGVSIGYLDPFKIKIKFWILCASPNCDTLPSNKKGKLAGFLVWANERLKEERAGIVLEKAGDDWIVDQTGASGNPSDFLLDFAESGCADEDGNHADFDRRIGTMRSDGVINIYMVRTVEDSNHKFDERNGIQCSWSYDSVVVGRSAIWGTILHEIGHVFSLTHSDENDWSDEVGGDKNIMNSYSRTRRSLTEGQVFRMNFSQDSGLNHGLSQVPSASLPDHRRPRDCRVDHPDPPCPEEQLMLWSDR